MPTPETALPIASALPALRRALADSCRVLLQAPPGAGKTTAVPPALLDADWLAGRRIVMLEPRRLAARAAARHMARQRGEAVGATVGYRTRLDSRIGPRTRIEVVTEGVLTRLLQADPGLEGTGLLIFDEFHERHLQGDLGLALALEAQAALRPDLRLLVMSATLDLPGLAAALPDAAVIEVAAAAHPVTLAYAGRPERRALPAAVAAAAGRALAEGPGDVLVFLPGLAEIRQVERRLREAATPAVLHCLHGSLPAAAQDAALQPDPDGRRKVVLASAIAESSLTVDGVRAVVDAGLARRARFAPATGMTRLVTERVSQAAAAQRAGRAGRQGPGRCLRLWSEAEQLGLPPRAPPEITDADLAPLALDLALWGSPAEALAWLDPPPAAALARAQALLRQLGAVDDVARITPLGRRMAGLGLHPRLAHMLLAAGDRGEGALAAGIAALLSERDLLADPAARADPDLERRLLLLRQPRPASGLVDAGTHRRARQLATMLRRRLGAAADGAGEADTARAGAVLALAYPDRLAQRRAGAAGRYRLAGGGGARLPEASGGWQPDWLAVAALDGPGPEPVIRLAAVVEEAEVAAAGPVAETEEVAWEAPAGAVVARRRRRLGALVLREEPLAEVAPARLAAAFLDGVRALGLERLPWTEAARQLRARTAFLRRRRPQAGWPDLSDEALLATLEQWLGPHVTGMRRAEDLRRVDLVAALSGLLSGPQRAGLAQEAPARIRLPDGRSHPLDYTAGDRPVLAVRLQALLGQRETPTVSGDPVELHLLSPAGRPVQITRDLGGFWRGSYAEVRRQLRGRYPRHAWPDDPLRRPERA